MSMKQNIEIDGKQVPFKASAAIPRIYRMKFHRTCVPWRNPSVTGTRRVPT